MKRKEFFLTTLATATSLKGLAQNNVIDLETNNKIVKPKYLRKGSTIGITCPAGYLTLEEAQPAIKKLEEWGYNIKLGKTLGLRSGTFAGTDAERLSDLQAMLNDDAINAIMCGRGGYGCNRIIDDLDFSKFCKNPKWLIGFSDITLLHTHINTKLNIATIHSKMCNSFLSDWSKGEALQIDSINSIDQVLKGNKMKYTAIPNTTNKIGTASGKLVGGNLSIIYSAMNTPSQLNTKNCILFLEEVGEYLYSIDRMMWNLKRSGALKHLKGLIIGGMKHKPAEKAEDEFGETVKDIVLNLTKIYNYPVCFDFPVGHQKINYALQCGLQHQLIVKPDNVTLLQM